MELACAEFRTGPCSRLGRLMPGRWQARRASDPGRCSSPSRRTEGGDGTPPTRATPCFWWPGPRRATRVCALQRPSGRCTARAAPPLGPALMARLA
eukprot:7993601-Pyramimonas_sp.AAC.1